jgi:hypothetical protein
MPNTVNLGLNTPNTGDMMGSWGITVIRTGLMESETPEGGTIRPSRPNLGSVL